MKKNNINNKKICVISTFGHCGIDWLHSLIDSHRNILIMPGFSFFRTVETLQDVLDVQSLDNVSIELLCNELTDLVYKGVAYQVIRRKFINNKQDSVEYRDHLLNYLQKSNIECIYSGLFFGMHSAFAKINNIDIENIELIVVQEHVPWHSMRYKKLFNPYFVFMMRDPRAALAGAWIRLKAAREDGNLHPYQFDHTIFYWKYAEAFVKKMARDNCNNVKVLKNEDMHKNLTYEMNELCNWININPSSSCTRQTFMGKEWLGESVYLAIDELKEPPPKNFYDKNQIESRWRGAISEKEIRMIESICANIFDIYKYTPDNKSQLMHRAQGVMNCMTINLGNFESKNVLLKILIILRNLSRRIAIIFFPFIVKRLFKLR